MALEGGAERDRAGRRDARSVAAVHGRMGTRPMVAMMVVVLEKGVSTYRA